MRRASVRAEQSREPHAMRVTAVARRGASAARGVHGQLRRRPPARPLVPQPDPKRRGEPGLRLEHALLACDLKPYYLDCWPLARVAWAEVAGLEARLILVAAPHDVSDE